MSILIIGRHGQVARQLMQQAAARGLEASVLARPEFDLERPQVEAISARGPRVIINAAAYTAVDRAETESARAYAINAEGAAAVARAAAGIGAALIHVSTDYVFSGDKPAPYLEDDPTGPTGVYGASKLAGEQSVREHHPGAIIVRTAWVYDAEGANFIRTMLRLAKSRPEISVVADQRGNPTSAADLASALLDLAARPEQAGVYHCAGTGDTTWAEFAQAVFATAEALGGPRAAVRPIATKDYPTPAKRPANSRLDCSKLARDYGVRLRPWQEGVAACVEQIAAARWSVE